MMDMSKEQGRQKVTGNATRKQGDEVSKGSWNLEPLHDVIESKIDGERIGRNLEVTWFSKARAPYLTSSSDHQLP